MSSLWIQMTYFLSRCLCVVFLTQVTLMGDSKGTATELHGEM